VSDVISVWLAVGETDDEATVVGVADDGVEAVPEDGAVVAEGDDVVDGLVLVVDGAVVVVVGEPAAGVTAALTEEYEPVPCEFTAATLNSYESPLVKPVIVRFVVVPTPSL
jgi:hypothetical protein